MRMSGLIARAVPCVLVAPVVCVSSTKVVCEHCCECMCGGLMNTQFSQVQVRALGHEFAGRPLRRSRRIQQGFGSLLPWFCCWPFLRSYIWLLPGVGFPSSDVDETMGGSRGAPAVRPHPEVVSLVFNGRRRNWHSAHDRQLHEPQ